MSRGHIISGLDFDTIKNFFQKKFKHEYTATLMVTYIIMTFIYIMVCFIKSCSLFEAFILAVDTFVPSTVTFMSTNLLHVLFINRNLQVSKVAWIGSFLLFFVASSIYISMNFFLVQDKTISVIITSVFSFVLFFISFFVGGKMYIPVDSNGKIADSSN